MWPFTKKEPKRDYITEAIVKLKEFKDVGETFNYLGRQCIVTGYWDYEPNVGYIPMLKFDYADDMGRLHHFSTRVFDLPTLSGAVKQP